MSVSFALVRASLGAAASSFDAAPAVACLVLLAAWSLAAADLRAVYRLGGLTPGVDPPLAVPAA